MPNKLRIKLITILLLLMPSGLFANEPDEIHLVIPRPLDSPTGKFVVSIYDEVYKQLGIKLKASSCQALQCALYVKQGSVDGELARAISYAKKVPGLVRVEESSHALVFAGYTGKNNIRFSNFQDLKESNYRIAYISGYFALDKEFKALAGDARIIKVSHWKNGLLMLNEGKADVFIGIEHAVNPGLQTANFQNIKQVAVLKSVPAYSFLHKKHALLAKRVGSVLRKMKQSGRINAISDTVFTQNP